MGICVSRRCLWDVRRARSRRGLSLLCIRSAWTRSIHVVVRVYRTGVVLGVRPDVGGIRWARVCRCRWRRRIWLSNDVLGSCIRMRVWIALSRLRLSDGWACIACVWGYGPGVFERVRRDIVSGGMRVDRLGGCGCRRGRGWISRGGSAVLVRVVS